MEYTSSYRNTALFVICIAAALVPFMGSAVNLSLPQIAQDYNLNSIAQSWVITGFLIASAIFLVPFGRIADMFGLKKIFTIGLGVITLSSLACAFPYGGVYLIVCRIIQGIGCAMVFGTGMALITLIFPPKIRGKAMGINVAVVYTALAVGPPIGGFITQQLGWEYIFIIIAVFSFIAFLGTYFFIKEEEIPAKGEHFDVPNALMYSVGLLLLIGGFTLIPSSIGFVMMLLGIIMLVQFVRFQRKSKYPLLNVEMFFTNRLFTYSSFAALINYSVTFPISYFMSLYLQQVKGFDPQYAGMILIVQPIVQATFSPIAGRLSDKTHSHYLASTGMLLISLALVAIALFLSPTSSVIFIIVILITLGVGFAAFSSPNTNTIMGSVQKKDYSMASSTTGTMRLTGQAFSMGITTMLLALFLSGEKISSETAPQFMNLLHWAFIIFALLSAVGIYASMKRGTK